MAWKNASIQIFGIPQSVITDFSWIDNPVANSDKVTFDGLEPQNCGIKLGEYPVGSSFSLGIYCGSSEGSSNFYLVGRNGSSSIYENLNINSQTAKTGDDEISFVCAYDDESSKGFIAFLFGSALSWTFWTGNNPPTGGNSYQYTLITKQMKSNWQQVVFPSEVFSGYQGTIVNTDCCRYTFHWRRPDQEEIENINQYMTGDLFDSANLPEGEHEVYRNGIYYINVRRGSSGPGYETHFTFGKDPSTVIVDVGIGGNGSYKNFFKVAVAIDEPNHEAAFVLASLSQNNYSAGVGFATSMTNPDRTAASLYNWLASAGPGIQFWKSLRSITGKKGSFRLSDILNVNDGEAVDDVPNEGNVNFAKVTKVNNLITNALGTDDNPAKAKVSFEVPEGTYDTLKLVFKKDGIPTSIDDGTAITISQEDTEAYVNGLIEASSYFFKIFAGQTESEAVKYTTGNAVFLLDTESELVSTIISDFVCYKDVGQSFVIEDYALNRNFGGTGYGTARYCSKTGLLKYKAKYMYVEFQCSGSRSQAGCYIMLFKRVISSFSGAWDPENLYYSGKIFDGGYVDVEKNTFSISLDRLGENDVFYIGFNQADTGSSITKIYFDDEVIMANQNEEE